jgi:hypothetical protein
MGGSRVKPVAPEHWQVVLVQKGVPLVLRVTVRDRVGAPIPNMSVSMTQNGLPLAGPAKQPLKTDAKGRVDVAGFDGGTLTFLADPTYVPPDTGDTRDGQPQRYTYSLARMTAPAECELVPADDGSTSGKTYFLDTQNAYVTVFCDVNPWVPVHRFPWQNPVHLSGADPIYAKRLEMLKVALCRLGQKPADVEGLDHPALVKALVDLYMSDTLFGGKKAPPPAAPPPSTSDGTADPTPATDPASDATEPSIPHAELPPPDPPVEPPPPSEPHPESAPTPTDVRVRPSDVTPAPPQPTSFDPGRAGAPTGTPGKTPNPNAIPHWIWYMIFHYSGLRYSPEARGKDGQDGAHGSYLDPSMLLKVLRGADIDALWANPTSNTPPADPDPTDVTEALALVSDVKIGEYADVPAGRVKDYRAALTSSDKKKVVGALRKLFLTMASKGETYLDRHADPSAPLLHGDHFALGLIKARHLVTPFPADQLKVLTSYTLLRNDVPADGWEHPLAAVKEFGALNKELNNHFLDWKSRHLKTLDLVSNSAVCNQLSEIAEQTRSNSDPPGGIPGNARNASKLDGLRLLAPKNFAAIQVGMHVFFPGWDDLKKKGQRWVNPDTAVEAFRLHYEKDDPLAAMDNVVAASSVPMLGPEWTYAVLHAMKAAEIVAKPEIQGVWRIDLSTFWTETGANKDGTAFLYIDPKGKVRVLQWKHQEIVIGKSSPDVRAQTVYTFSTSANYVVYKKYGDWGLGIRTHGVDSGRFRDWHALVGFLTQSTEDRDGLLLPCYLDATVLQRVG